MSESGARPPVPDTHDRPVRRARTRSMVVIGIAIAGLFLILLVAGAVPRIRNQRALSAAAQKMQTELTQVYVVRPQPAAEAGLSLAATTQALDQSVSTYRTAQAALAAAEANVESNRANVQRYEEMTSFQRILAPFSGTVIQRNVDVGALITAGSPVNNTAVAPSSVTGAASGLFEIAQIDTLRVFVNVPQVYATTLKVGLPVEVAVRGQLMEPVAGTVTRTAGAIDPGTRTLLAQVDIPNPSHRLFAGMFVYVNFKIAPAGTHWRVPSTAIVFNAKGTRVAIVGPGNKLHFQDVILGRDFGTSIDIQGGLQGNEAVVKQPTVSLREGQVVTPIESPNPSGGQPRSGGQPPSGG